MSAFQVELEKVDDRLGCIVVALGAVGQFMARVAAEGLTLVAAAAVIPKPLTLLSLRPLLFYKILCYIALNAYAYCGNNSIDKIDTVGLASVGVVLIEAHGMLTRHDGRGHIEAFLDESTNGHGLEAEVGVMAATILVTKGRGWAQAGKRLGQSAMQRGMRLADGFLGGGLKARARQAAWRREVCTQVSRCFVAGTLVDSAAAGARPIEEMKVGQRVWTPGSLADPDGSRGTAVDPECWLKLTLESPQSGPHGQRARVEMLRGPPSEGEEPLEVGQMMWVVYGEGPDGVEADWLELRSVEPCPPIEEGPGRVVMRTMSGVGLDLFRLRLEGSEGEVVATGGHRFRTAAGRWRALSELEIGEELVLADGVGRVAQVEALVGQGGAVYNLEVEGEHCYFVGEKRALVHNAGCPPDAAIAHPSAGRSIHLSASSAMGDIAAIGGSRGTGFVYVLRDLRTGKFLKVGKTSGGRNIRTRFNMYRRKTLKRGDDVAVDFWQLGTKQTAGAFERQMRNNLLEMGFDLPWDRLAPGRTKNMFYGAPWTRNWTETPFTIE